MATDDKGRPERKLTDASLREERAKSDAALAEKQATIDVEADSVIRLARKTADAVLSEARGTADQKLEASARASTSAVLAEERAAEDRAVLQERASADELLELQRDEIAAVLSRRLPVERAQTDSHLETERLRHDAAVANRDDFLFVVCHDLRNLLGGIVQNATLLSAREVLEKAGQEERAKNVSAPVERIHRLAARMNRLLGDLLDIASIDAGKLSITMAPVDASSFIAEAADAFEKAASARSISLELELEKPLMVDCDHDRLFQVLANLITNALKFTPEGGQIKVRGERSGDDALVSVSDTGPGIPGDMLEAIFERFRQVGKSGSGGLGLGLYISKVIVEAHGGKIWAESQPGEGSKLSFTIPGARPAPG